MKQWTFRMPDDLLEWLRIKAAQETIRRKTVVSMNALVVEILTDKRESDQYWSAEEAKKRKRPAKLAEIQARKAVAEAAKKGGDR